MNKEVIDQVLSELLLKIIQEKGNSEFSIRKNIDKFPLVKNVVDLVKDPFTYNCQNLPNSKKFMGYLARKEDIRDFSILTPHDMSKQDSGIYLYAILYNGDTDSLQTTFVKTENFLEFGTKHAGLIENLDSGIYANFRLIIAGEISIHDNTVKFNCTSGTLNSQIFENHTMISSFLEFVTKPYNLGSLRSQLRMLGIKYTIQNAKEINAISYSDIIANIAILIENKVCLQIKKFIFDIIFTGKTVVYDPANALLRRYGFITYIEKGLGESDVDSYGKSLCEKPYISRNLYVYDSEDECESSLKPLLSSGKKPESGNAFCDAYRELSPPVYGNRFRDEYRLD